MCQCLCRSSCLLRHIQPRKIYWFCPHCRQEMPPLDASGLMLQGITSREFQQV